MTGIRSHAAAIFLSVFFGILAAGPFILIATNASFAGMFPEIVDDQNSYLARIQDVRDGYLMSGNPYILEHKGTPPQQFFTGEIIEAGILEALHLPTQYSLILFPLIFCPLIFMLTYGIFLGLGTPKFWATIGAVMLCGIVAFSEFTRPISPQFNFLFWLLPVWWFFRLGQENIWKWSAVQATLIGILFYIYPYYWTHLVTVAIVIFLVSAYMKDGKTMRAMFFSVCGAALVAIPYVLLALKVHALPFHAESLARLGFVSTHTPSGVGLILIYGLGTAIVLFFTYRYRRFEKNLIVALALILGGFVAMNQHLITGINMEFASHYALQIQFSYYFAVAATLTAFGFWNHLTGAQIRIATVAVAIIVSVIAVTPTYMRAQTASATLPAYAQAAEIITWLNAHAKPGTVVYADEELSSFIPGYTKENAFFARYANFGFMPNAEVVDRFSIQNYFSHIDGEFIRKHERHVFGVQHINAYNHASIRARALSYLGIESSVPERIPEERIQDVIARARDLQSQPLEDVLKPYHVSYLILEKEQAFPGRVPVYETTDFNVFLNEQ